MPYYRNPYEGVSRGLGNLSDILRETTAQHIREKEGRQQVALQREQQQMVGELALEKAGAEREETAIRTGFELRGLERQDIFQERQHEIKMGEQKISLEGMRQRDIRAGEQLGISRDIATAQISGIEAETKRGEMTSLSSLFDELGEGEEISEQRAYAEQAFGPTFNRLATREQVSEWMNMLAGSVDPDYIPLYMMTEEAGRTTERLAMQGLPPTIDSYIGIRDTYGDTYDIPPLKLVYIETPRDPVTKEVVKGIKKEDYPRHPITIPLAELLKARGKPNEEGLIIEYANRKLKERLGSTEDQPFSKRLLSGPTPHWGVSARIDKMTPEQVKVEQINEITEVYGMNLPADVMDEAMAAENTSAYVMDYFESDQGKMAQIDRQVVDYNRTNNTVIEVPPEVMAEALKVKDHLEYIKQYLEKQKKVGVSVEGKPKQPKTTYGEIFERFGAPGVAVRGITDIAPKVYGGLTAVEMALRKGAGAFQRGASALFPQATYVEERLLNKYDMYKESQRLKGALEINR